MTTPLGNQLADAAIRENGRPARLGTDHAISCWDFSQAGRLCSLCCSGNKPFLEKE